MNYKYCPNCGAKVKLSAKFCIKCGYHFTSNDVVSHNSFSSSSKPTSNSSKLLKQSNSNQSNKNSSGCGFLVCAFFMVLALGTILKGFGLSTGAWAVVSFCIGIPVYGIYEKLYH